jgi:hypothetical protein
MSEAKPFCISKKEVWKAYELVKENKGGRAVGTTGARHAARRCHQPPAGESVSALRIRSMAGGALPSGAI